MLATLPMYDWPEVRADNDARWTEMRDRLRTEGVDAPEKLDRQVGYQSSWTRSDLVLGEACGLPYIEALKDEVALIGAMDLELEGCNPGQYNSLIIVHQMSDLSMDDLNGKPYAFNTACSQSGLASIQKMGLTDGDADHRCDTSDTCAGLYCRQRRRCGPLPSRPERRGSGDTRRLSEPALIMELWIAISIAAAFVQNLRFMLQKHLKGQLSSFGATYAEAVQAAIIGFVLLGDKVAASGIIAIIVSVIGVILMSVNISDLSLRGVFSRPTLLGLGSGMLLGISGVTYRGASLSLDGGDFLMRAALTLAAVTVFQTIVMSIYLKWREPGEIGRVISGWRITSLVGLTGMLGSLGWFAAMTLQNAAYVKAVGQIELVFAIAASYFFFKERPSLRDIAGIILIVLGIWLLLISR